MVPPCVPPPKITTAREIFDKTTAFFAEKGIPSPQLDAALLVGEVLGYDRLKLYLNFERPMSEAEIARARELVRRRAVREPVAYILGRKEFAGREFKVGPGVLVPRPDTEMLVDEATRELRERFDGAKPDRRYQDTNDDEAITLTQTAELSADEQGAAPSIDSNDQPENAELAEQPEAPKQVEHADLANVSVQDVPGDGTDFTSPITVLEFGIGSGAIAVTLAAENLRVHVTATEISEAAAALARENVAAHDVADRVHIRMQSDFAGIDGPFHVIVSNPPYVDPAEKPDLSPDVANYEPAEALFADDSGLQWYKFLARESMRLLIPGGFIAVEIGYRQREAVEKIFTDAGLNLIRSVKDFAGHDRVVMAGR